MEASQGQGAHGLDVALRRVVVGYRVVAVLWLWILAVLAIVTEPRADVGLVAATGGVATLWTGLVAWRATQHGDALRAPLWIAADVVVSGAVVVLATAAARRGFFGGYPFATVLQASYAGGYAGGLSAAAVLAAVSFAALGSEAVSSALVYLVGAGVAVWGIGVMTRSELQRRDLEARLANEESERARSQERADTAAALHDSVLQTLALIQRRNDDPAAVASLARQQERDLREWLGGQRVRLGGTSATTLAAAVKDAAADIEERYGLTVDVVTVGDVALSERAEALVAAAREALVNVAQHAGVATVSVYVEVSASGAAVFVRDRGAGFDAAVVPEQRRGIAQSIVGRMQRHAGVATVRTAPGEGTEVELRLPFPADDPVP